MPPDPSDNSYLRRLATLGDQTVGIATYRVGSLFACRIDNVDPGAIIARATAATREEAEEAAIASAALSLKLKDANKALARSVEQLRSKRRDASRGGNK